MRLTKRLLPALFVLTLAAGLTGCVENAMLVRVARDGSGSLTYRLFLNDEMLEALRGLAIAPHVGGPADEAPPVPDLDTLFEGMVASVGAQLGTGITLEQHSRKTNRLGWQGFEAVYAIPDVNNLRLDGINPLGPTPAREAGGTGADVPGRYRFRFTPGDPARLELEPLAAPARPAEDAPPATWADRPEDHARLEGLRVALYLHVEGEVTETNARHPSAARRNVITLLDIPFDSLRDSPEALAALAAPGGVDAEALAGLDAPGLRVEEPGKTVRILFR